MEIPQDTLIIFDNYIDLFTKQFYELIKLDKTQNILQKSLKKVKPHADYSEFAEIEKLNDFNALLTISILDFCTILKGMSHTTKTWEQFYFIKQAFLTIYETLKTYDDFNQTLNEVTENKYPSVRKSYLKIAKLLKKFKKDFGYNREMQNVRNFTTGHIDKSLALYYSTILSITKMEVVETMMTFFNLQTELLNFSRDLGAAAKIGR